MKKTINCFALASCFVLGTTAAHANPDSSQGSMQDKMFKDMDTNSDGMVTKDEFNNFGAKKFTELDSNGDGQVTSKEMKDSHKKVDGSGKIRNKMDDDGLDPKGKERSTNMSGDRDQQDGVISKGNSSNQGREGYSRGGSSGGGSNSSGSGGH